MKTLINRRLKLAVGWGVSLALMLFVFPAFSAATSLGDVAANITGTFENVAKLITGGCYLAGLAFAITAIMKFKQHKDNPTQITIGTPIALVFIAGALLFLPSILTVTGSTMFGSGGASTSGPSGSVYTGQ